MAEARFLRGFANFLGAYTFGGIPKVTTTVIATNRNIPRATREDILQSVLADYTAALPDLPATNANKTLAKTFATKNAARAALARYYLYQKDWAQAEKFATEVIATKLQTLPDSIADVFFQEVDGETIFEVAYANNSSDDPGTSTFGLNDVLRGRREVIPANTYILTMLETNAGRRSQTISFDPLKQRGPRQRLVGAQVRLARRGQQQHHDFSAWPSSTSSGPRPAPSRGASGEPTARWPT